MGLYSRKLYQNQRVLRRSIYIEPVLTSREECDVFADLLFKIYLCFSRDFVKQHVFLLLDLHWDSPKLPWGIQRICGPFCFEDYHYAFQETLCPVTLAHQIFVFYSNLYFYTSDTFRPILVLFTHFTLQQFFLMYITTRNIFLFYPWWCCCSEFNHYF